MASAVRHLRCLAHTWLHFALCPSGHWPRSAPEIRFAAIRNRRNPDTCDLSLPTPTSVSHPPSGRPGRASEPQRRPILSLACSHARLHASSQRPRVYRILAFSIAVFLATPSLFLAPALPMPLVRAASILFLALPCFRWHPSARPPIPFVALRCLRWHTFSLSLFRFARRIASVSRAPT
jgi:hypothetical protein